MTVDRVGIKGSDSKMQECQVDGKVQAGEWHSVCCYQECDAEENRMTQPGSVEEMEHDRVRGSESGRCKSDTLPSVGPRPGGRDSQAQRKQGFGQAMLKIITEAPGKSKDARGKTEHCADHGSVDRSKRWVLSFL